MELIENAAGRKVPSKVNGTDAIPYKGIGNHIPKGRKYAPAINSCANFPSNGDKRVAGLKEALQRAGLKDGMTISTHHHFRNGDYLANLVFDIAHELGVKGLRWFPSASFPCHEHLIQYL
jgi:citrate lyase subunit alpha / citrate CoA-transferase